MPTTNKGKRIVLGKTEKRILLIVSGLLAAGLTRSSYVQWKIFSEVRKEWRRINLEDSNGIRTIHSLLTKGLLKQRISEGGKEIMLTNTGVKAAAIFSLENLALPIHKKWDGRWRILMTDIPERRKRSRDDLRYHLNRLGFVELQKSAWVYPYNCKNAIEKLLHFLELEKYATYVVAQEITNDQALLKHFKV